MEYRNWQRTDDECAYVYEYVEYYNQATVEPITTQLLFRARTP